MKESQLYYLRAVDDESLELRDCFCPIDTDEETIQAICNVLMDSFPLTITEEDGNGVYCEAYLVTGDINKYKNYYDSDSFVENECKFLRYYYYI